MFHLTTLPFDTLKRFSPDKEIENIIHSYLNSNTANKDTLDFLLKKKWQLLSYNFLFNNRDIIKTFQLELSLLKANNVTNEEYMIILCGILEKVLIRLGFTVMANRFYNVVDFSKLHAIYSTVDIVEKDNGQYDITEVYRNLNVVFRNTINLITQEFQLNNLFPVDKPHYVTYHIDPCLLTVTIIL